MSCRRRRRGVNEWWPGACKCATTHRQCNARRIAVVCVGKRALHEPVSESQSSAHNYDNVHDRRRVASQCLVCATAHRTVMYDVPSASTVRAHPAAGVCNERDGARAHYTVCTACTTRKGVIINMRLCACAYPRDCAATATATPTTTGNCIIYSTKRVNFALVNSSAGARANKCSADKNVRHARVPVVQCANESAANIGGGVDCVK